MPTRRENVKEALAAVAEARARGLMHATIEARRGKTVVLEGGRTVVEFINCSYLGLDTHPAVVDAAAAVVREWGVHFCCARSRFTIAPNRDLEEELSALFRGHAITFPSVTSAHLSTLPLVASGALLPSHTRAGIRLVFDRFAHASMQCLKPMLAVDATVVTIAHNDVAALAREIDAGHAADEDVVYVADSVYSMGGVCPLAEVQALAAGKGAFLYLDDAHGTSIFGVRGEGFVLASCQAERLPGSTIMTFSLAKGFGANGGGVVLPTEEQRQIVRALGQTYAFSAPLDFSVVAAARAAHRLHVDGTVASLQQRLREKVALFDTLRERRDDVIDGRNDERAFTPIRMIAMPSRERALEVGDALVARGFFVSVAMYPVVPRDQPQLRVCISVEHHDDEIRGLVAALHELGVTRSVP